MNFEEPIKKGITIYSKSGCINCNKLKQLLKNRDIFYIEINCDEYLVESKEYFLQFIKNKAGVNYKIFPMVFYDEKFIGGFSDTCQFIDDLTEKLLLSFGDNF